MDEAFILSPQQEQERYLQHTNSPEDTGYVDMLHQFLSKCVFPFHDRIRTALDYGCGPGPVLAGILTDMNIRTDSYDPYFAPHEIYRGKTYSLITCTEVVEHLRDPLPVLQKLGALLEPGGLLAIMTLFHPVDNSNQEEGERLFKNWWYRRDPTHISFFNRDTFTHISSLLGLNMIYIDHKNSLTLQK